MSPASVVLVQDSFKHVVPIKDTAAELFYGRLFELDPTLRPLFRGEMKAQHRKLMDMLAAAVNGLSNPPEIIGAVQALGARHVHYGVQDSHYATVGSALLWTLEQGLGAAFTPEVRGAWTEAYVMLADVMKAAARTTV